MASSIFYPKSSIKIDMQISINGEQTTVDNDLNLAKLVEMQELQGKRIAIEVNEELVSRTHFESHLLKEGDQVEIVQAIGGG